MTSKQKQFLFTLFTKKKKKSLSPLVQLQISIITHVYPVYLQQVAFILLHDAVAIEWGEDCVYDPLRVLMIESLSCHQTGCHQSRVLPQPAQELPVDALLKT